MLRKGTKPKWIGQWPQKPKKKRKCSVLTKHVKEYIKKEEEEDNKKKKTKTKTNKEKPKKNKLLLLKSLVFFSCGDPIHVISYIRSG